MKRFALLVVMTLAVAVCVVFFGCASSSSSQSAVSDSSSAASASAASDSSGEAASTSEAASGSSNSAKATGTQPALEDGEYIADVTTDSSMFHLNETCDGKCSLTVSDGQMTVHMILTSKKITMLYPGTVEQAKADEAGWIHPTNDEVTYSDGEKKEVYGFDVPVPALDEPFAVAILGSKSNWYDHEVTVSNPVSK
ncbi:MAG: hypothetical protein IJH88_03385 [Eggerthellaceae bacterium]|nr:hypothetical protein [Eggerthellaceae bacterium]